MGLKPTRNEQTVRLSKVIGYLGAMPAEPGIGGYEDMLEVISHPDHEDHERRLQWLGGNEALAEFQTPRPR
jgi:hypothetical protein